MASSIVVNLKSGGQHLTSKALRNSLIEELVVIVAALLTVGHSQHRQVDGDMVLRIGSLRF